MTARAGGREAREVVVVGAGFGGIAAAVRLRAAGYDDVLVLEQAHDLGGTWRDAVFPGAGCDVPSALYSLSFAPDPDWTRAYAGQAEILAYLRRTADAHGVTGRIRFGTRLERADWDERAHRWHLTTTGGGSVDARWVVAACGPLHRPALPDLPGLAAFTGDVFHSARWRHDVDLRGRRVAVLGTGASALQFVPEIAPTVERLVLLQRTPQWVLPKPDRGISGTERRLFRRVPAAQRAVRWAAYLAAETLTAGIRRPGLLAPLQRLARRHLRRQVGDPDLRARLTPTDRLGCRRILVSNDWYPALARDNVTVADGHVRGLGERSVIDGDGRTHDIDALVLATGYEAAEPAVARLFHDGSGRAMADHFAVGGAGAHLGTSVRGFPNLFLLAGPNSFVYSSLVAVMEAQLDHAVAVLTAARERDVGRVEIEPTAADAFHAEVGARLTRTVWTTGCRSWFTDEQGRNTTMWPGTTTELRRRLRRVDLATYRFGPPVSPSPTPPASR